MNFIKDIVFKIFQFFYFLWIRFLGFLYWITTKF